MLIQIQRTIPSQAETLTEIAFAAKRYWSYPEHWIQFWSPILTISAEFIEQYETFIVYLGHEPVRFCAISMEFKKVGEVVNEVGDQPR